MTRAHPGRLEILATVGVVGDLADGELLRLCLDGGEAGARSAFSALVERHGPMVQNVCRRALGDPHEADDAFQATFLILARKAHSVRKVDSVASWLHGVALRVSRSAREAAIRRRDHERKAAEMRGLTYDLETDHPASWPELHEEIARLPARYREPLVLCYLQGLSTAAAARRLRCPQGTIQSRLSRARERLRAQLIRRGLAPDGILIGEEPPRRVENPAVSGALLGMTVELAVPHFVSSTVASTASASVSALTEGVLQAMVWTDLKAYALAGFAIATLATTTGGVLAFQGKNEPGAAVAKEAPRNTDKPASPVTVPFGPLPAREELHRLLRQVAIEAIATARSGPILVSEGLGKIADLQAKVGDIDGARSTFAEAVKMADREFGAAATAYVLLHIGRSQAEVGLRDEALVAFRRAVEAMKDAGGDDEANDRTTNVLIWLIEEQSKLGAREEARKTTDRLLAFSRRFLEKKPIVKAHDVGVRENERGKSVAKVAVALVAIGDFEAAFKRVEGTDSPGSILGEIAITAAECLDRDTARRFVREAETRLARLARAEVRSSGLDELAVAQARIGEFDAAKRTVRAIPSRTDEDEDGWSRRSSALIRIAVAQRQAGEAAGARETLREAFRMVEDHPLPEPARNYQQLTGRDGLFLRIAYEQLAGGDTKGAGRSINMMRNEPAEDLARFAQWQAAAGDRDAARACLARALAEARLSVRNPPEPDLQPVFAPGTRPAPAPGKERVLATIQATAGDMAGALRTFRTIKEPDDRGAVLERIVSAQATAGDVAGALRLALEEAKSPDKRRSALVSLAAGLDARLSLASLRPRGD